MPDDLDGTGTDSQNEGESQTKSQAESGRQKVRLEELPEFRAYQSERDLERNQWEREKQEMAADSEMLKEQIAVMQEAIEELGADPAEVRQAGQRALETAETRAKLKRLEALEAQEQARIKAQQRIDEWVNHWYRAAHEDGVDTNSAEFVNLLNRAAENNYSNAIMRRGIARLSLGRQEEEPEAMESEQQGLDEQRAERARQQQQRAQQGQFTSLDSSTAQPPGQEATVSELERELDEIHKLPKREMQEAYMKWKSKARAAGLVL